LIEEFAITQERVAESVGKSRSHVANTMRLLKLPAAVQTELRKGTLSAGHARALLAHPDPARAALAVIAQGLNVRQTEALAARQSNDDGSQKPKEIRAKDPDIERLVQELQDKLGLAVSITPRGRGGVLRFDYNGPDQLEGLLALLLRP
jgi:ParB family chromosome partitioning protein